MLSWLAAALVVVLMVAAYRAFPALGEWDRAVLSRLFPHDRL